VAGLADDVAYNSHDLDDGLAAKMFTLDDLEDGVPWVADIIRAKRKDYPGISERLLEQETIRDVMGTYIHEILGETRRRLRALDPQSPDDIRHSKTATAAMSDDLRRKDRVLRDFLWAHFYRHHEVSRVRLKVFRCVQDLFRIFMENRRCLPPEWFQQFENVPKGWKKENWQARTVADYIASMTDRLALLEHRDLFDAQREMQ
jgi:dGTPase